MTMTFGDSVWGVNFEEKFLNKKHLLLHKVRPRETKKRKERVRNWGGEEGGVRGKKKKTE